MHLPLDELTRRGAALAPSPRDRGTVEMIVIRPREDAREVLDEAALTAGQGVVGDAWHADDGGADRQITMMNRRVLDLMAAGDRSRWPLAGDQLIVDLDIGEDNLRPGDRLRVGTALVEVTPEPHTGCSKFAARYGVDALRWANGPEGRTARRRGIYVRVLEDGVVRAGDGIAKVPPTG